MHFPPDGQLAEHEDPSRLHVEDVVRAGEHTLVLTGEVDLLGAPVLEQAMRRLCVEGTTGVVLDLRKVTFMDSTGLRVTLAAQGLCRTQGYEFSLIPGPQQVQSLFEMTGLLELLPFQGDGQSVALSQDALLPKLFAPGDLAEDDAG